VFGPHPRSYAQKTPKKMIAAALLGVLSDRARDGLIFVIDSIVKGETPSTKAATTTLAHVGNYANLLVILDRDDYTGWLSLRNLPEVHLLAVDQLNAYDVVTSDAVVFTKAALELFIAGASYSNTVRIIVADEEDEVLDGDAGEIDYAPEEVAEADEVTEEAAEPTEDTEKEA
jgi:large subunit ribosomal protein L4